MVDWARPCFYAFCQSTKGIFANACAAKRQAIDLGTAFDKLAHKQHFQRAGTGNFHGGGDQAHAKVYAA